MDREIAPWVRFGMFFTLAIPQLVTGVWAVFDPSGWFASFPGLGPNLVAAEPPYNAHLATDAGAGFLATGVALALATLWARRQVVLLALATFVAFALPHAVYHAAHQAPGLSGAENSFNVALLFSSVGLAVLFVWGALRPAPSDRSR